MTPESVDARRLNFGLNLLGVALVTFGLVTSRPIPSTIVLVLAGVSVGSWVVRASLQFAGRRPLTAIDATMLVTGALAAPGTNGLTLVTACVVIVGVVADVSRSALLGVVFAAIAFVVIPFASIGDPLPVLGLLSIEAAVLLAVLIGVSRRQRREAEEQNRVLRERELDIREERARVQLLSDREGVARDIHDVLAHSLGGLVIQLDAVEALLEAGAVAAAQSRVRDARALAASGLGDARRAVAALRDPGEPGNPDGRAMEVTGDELVIALNTLLEAHRSLQGRAELVEIGERHVLGENTSNALQRALQEALSNARKHAPGEPVAAELRWSADAVRLSVSNTLPPAEPTASAGSTAHELAASGGGHGIEGMRERFAALPAGGAVTAGADAERTRYTVVAEAVLR